MALTSHRGAVIINDVTARERQRDHKQFYIGEGSVLLPDLISFLPVSLHSRQEPRYILPNGLLAFPRSETSLNTSLRDPTSCLLPL
jgi:hypothetical protein